MSAREVYLKKVEKGGYEAALEEIRKYERGEIGIVSWSIRWENSWSAYNSAIDKLKELKGTPRGVVIAKVFEAISYLRRRMPNRDLALAAATQAVVMCEKMKGMTRDKCISLIADATSLTVSDLRRALGGGGATAGGGGGGAAV